MHRTPKSRRDNPAVVWRNMCVCKKKTYSHMSLKCTWLRELNAGPGIDHIARCLLVVLSADASYTRSLRSPTISTQRQHVLYTRSRAQSCHEFNIYFTRPTMNVIDYLLFLYNWNCVRSRDGLAAALGGDLLRRNRYLATRENTERVGIVVATREQQHV